MRIVNSFLLILVLSGCGGFRAPGQAAKSRVPAADTGKEGGRQVDAEQRALISDARSAPAEFAADALVRIAQTDRAISPALKRELLEDAFRRAGEAQHEVRKKYIGGNVDTRAGYLSYAFDLKLDTLSLRSRAVAAMLEVDKQKARSLIGEISPKLSLKPLGCEDALVYDVSEFYATLERVVREAFSPEELKQEAHIHFVQRYVDGIESPAQIGPSIGVMLAARPTPPQLASLVHSFNHALKRINEDDRSFSFALVRGRATQSRLLELIKACHQHSAGLHQDLLRAARAYLVRNMKAGRCADNPGHATFISSANRWFGFAEPISEEEAHPERVLGSAKSHEYWGTPQARKLLRVAQSLRSGPDNKPNTAADRGNPSWQQRASELINGMADWDEEKELSRADYFHQKSVLFESLIELVPDGALRDKVLADYVYFLRDSSIQRDHRMEWLMHVSNLLRRSRTASAEYAPRVLATLAESENLNLRLYAKLEKVKPATKPERSVGQ